jgi:cytosine/adenosine deaminase-related metal-dependent hydrolase
VTSKLPEPEPLLLKGPRVAVGAESAEPRELALANGVICALRPRVSDFEPGLTLNLEGRLILPGLINAHDHLEFGLFPRLGKGIYPDARSWALDIYRPDASPLRERLQISKTTRLFWGGLKNLFSGVTTVCHHNRYEPEVFEHDFPVRVVKHYGWSHSFDFSNSVQADYDATPAEAPFLIHLAEGTTERCRGEIHQLDRLGLLNSRTVLIHGVALSTDDWGLVRERCAKLIWCPSSNLFTLGTTLPLSAVRCGIRVALGNDSSLTAAGDLLQEIRCAHHLGLSAQEIYPLVTHSAAKVLKLGDGEGEIRENGVADLLVVRDTGGSPAQSLVSLSLDRIDLVLQQGSLLLVSADIAGQLPSSTASRLRPISYDGHPFWVGIELQARWNEASTVLGNEICIAGKPVHLWRARQSSLSD